MPIDEISEKLGFLQNGQDTVIRQLAAQGADIAKLVDRITIMNGNVANNKMRIDEITDPVDGDLTIAYAGAKDWVETKKQAKWMIFGGGLAGTAGGFSIGKMISALFGGHQ